MFTRSLAGQKIDSRASQSSGMVPHIPLLPSAKKRMRFTYGTPQGQALQVQIDHHSRVRSSANWSLVGGPGEKPLWKMMDFVNDRMTQMTFQPVIFMGKSQNWWQHMATIHQPGSVGCIPLIIITFETHPTLSERSNRQILIEFYVESHRTCWSYESCLTTQPWSITPIKPPGAGSNHHSPAGNIGILPGEKKKHVHGPHHTF